ncbi:MAG: Na+/H+ antiporter NhaC family protein [Bacteroidota bacterium]|nr:Na+/H+ antiporter NhaC family protein [Bacteroidota bacterium]
MRRKKQFIILFSIAIFFLTPFILFSSNNYSYHVEIPSNVIGLKHINAKITIVDKSNSVISTFNENKTFIINGETRETTFDDGIAHINIKIDGNKDIIFYPKDSKENKQFFHVRKLPAFLSIVPPLLAILLAIIFKEVILALFLGVFSGILLIIGFDDPLNWIRSPMIFIEYYVIKVVSDPQKSAVIIFSMIIGGMVMLLMKNGSIHILISKLSKVIKTRKNAMLVTWLMGIVVFFDDYANTLIVGNSLRPLTDRFKISREKLAYIVDSTAAPIASIAFITTWIGAEVNYINDAVIKLNIAENPYMIFLKSLGYAFYPLLTIVFMFMLLKMNRDFGQMHKIETLAIKDFKKHLKIHETKSAKNEYINPNKIKTKWYDAVIPMVSLILVAFVSLLFNHNSLEIWKNENLSLWMKFVNVIGSSNPYKALLWASFFGIGIAIIITLLRRSLSLKKSINAVIEGFNSMLMAMIILIFAWSLGIITEKLGTDVYLSEIIGGNVSPFFLPALIFLISAAISFATGSSWGTMALLYPILLPTVYNSCEINGLAYNETMPIFYMVVSAILGGSVFGDHCSPISDTTILSSMSSGCDHIQHVRTQLPYSLTVGFISVFIGYILVSYLKISPIWGLLISVLVLFGIVRIFGKKVNVKT